MDLGQPDFRRQLFDMRRRINAAPAWLYHHKEFVNGSGRTPAQMLDAGFHVHDHHFVPRQNDEPWVDYPPLVYWLGAASSRLLGGPTPFALRLPVAVSALLLVGLATRFTQAIAGRRVAVWTGITLATAPMFVWQAVNYHPDMVFATLASCGLGGRYFEVA